jgi:hypothetical protein
MSVLKTRNAWPHKMAQSSVVYCDYISFPLDTPSATRKHRKHLTCISSKHSRAAIRSPLPLLLLPAQPACGSALSALMKLRAAADITAALAAASRASGTLPARASLQMKQVHANLKPVVARRAFIPTFMHAMAAASLALWHPASTSLPAHMQQV